MKTRIIAGILVLLMVASVFFLATEWFYLVYLVLALICCNEFMHMLEQGGIAAFKLPSYIFTLLYTAVLFNTYNDLVIKQDVLRGRGYLVVSMFFIIFLLTIAMFNKRHDLKSIIYTAFGTLYAVVPLSFAVLVMELPDGKWLLGMILVGAIATDTFAYFTGYFWGKRKIVPKISPKKTVEGSIGGIAGSIIFMTIYTIIMKNVAGTYPGLVKMIIIIAETGVVSQLGDWAASFLKREFSIKDFGRLIPGHGGLLDRVDSLIFLLPLTYVIFII
ncbi:MAG TPA: phosphatidate cytidylyltransferase [Clostridia bacterium]|nr:phosphatidate cytidylyltransferase [Clostridia bacterium]HPQ45821.1 phosphatidate cytidylyltransferase [Clostridia bacterium]HRX42250.1 phosphatidate cytidylyltransferase [Clostridia bacterium]